MLENLDYFFRASASTLFIVQAALLLRDHRDLKAAVLFAPLAIAQSIELHLPCCSPDAVPTELLRFIARNTPIFVWWFSLALFDDDFKFGRIVKTGSSVWIVLNLIETGVAIGGATTPPVIDFIQLAAVTGIVLHIAWRLIGGLKSDLVEERRRMRFLFAAAITSILFSDLLTDVFLGNHWTPQWYLTLFNGGIFMLLVAGCFWIFRVDRSALLFVRPALTEPRQNLSAADQRLMENLNAAIVGGVFLKADLSIGGLAKQIGATEHRLRAYINGVLGYRNFRAFLNEHRINAAKSALSDPDQADVSILVIAMDAGFASLAPFNRAFKDATGLTPSAFRLAAAANANSDLVPDATEPAPDDIIDGAKERETLTDASDHR